MHFSGPFTLALFRFGAWMRRVIRVGQVLQIQARIDLGGADVGVSQQLLYAAQVAAGLQHMASKRVAQHVRMHWGAGVCQLAASL